MFPPKAELWRLFTAFPEVAPGLVKAIQEDKLDGLTWYDGVDKTGCVYGLCASLVGIEHSGAFFDHLRQERAEWSGDMTMLESFLMLPFSFIIHPLVLRWGKEWLAQNPSVVRSMDLGEFIKKIEVKPESVPAPNPIPVPEPTPEPVPVNR